MEEYGTWLSLTSAVCPHKVSDGAWRRLHSAWDVKICFPLRQRSLYSKSYRETVHRKEGKCSGVTKSKHKSHYSWEFVSGLQKDCSFPEATWQSLSCFQEEWRKTAMSRCASLAEIYPHRLAGAIAAKCASTKCWPEGLTISVKPYFTLCIFTNLTSLWKQTKTLFHWI